MASPPHLLALEGQHCGGAHIASFQKGVAFAPLEHAALVLQEAFCKPLSLQEGYIWPCSILPHPPPKMQWQLRKKI